MRISEEDRKRIWEEYQNIEYKIMSLKSIVQNDVEISIEDIESNVFMTADVVKDLEETMRNITKVIK